MKNKLAASNKDADNRPFIISKAVLNIFECLVYFVKWSISSVALVYV